MSADESHESPPADEPTQGQPSRRRFISSLTMAGGLGAGYGTLGMMAGRFLYPEGGAPKAWIFAGEVDRWKPGDALPFKTPAGQTITIARRGDSGTVADFLALSSICPHLGCRVHWEPQNHRFFCPCHNGVFDPEGKGTAGPPADAGQSLAPYPLQIDHGLLFIEVSVEKLS